MKRKIADKVEMIILLIIAIAGVIYISEKDKDLDKQIKKLQETQALQYRIVQIDNEEYLFKTK
ncbi:hypothetical protein E2605_14820 [Dysgonomonas capnocytophagoides]|uniref:Uncharacterized protein n=1 Tax=Dysgonomonas capnocytophagoides TaxID=45254 RepID=A0A4Y8KY59_9BACT|nr:hypothetical protein [Dysgonomonas capnocytophagoides]TFD94643.1 hypothetical protein E2605_14820 [Dysgonomonas capnocytophagoides]